MYAHRSFSHRPLRRTWKSALRNIVNLVEAAA
jgi:hypothetical protein